MILLANVYHFWKIEDASNVINHVERATLLGPHNPLSAQMGR